MADEPAAPAKAPKSPDRTQSVQVNRSPGATKITVKQQTTTTSEQPGGGADQLSAADQLAAAAGAAPVPTPPAGGKPTDGRAAEQPGHRAGQPGGQPSRQPNQPPAQPGDQPAAADQAEPGTNQPGQPGEAANRGQPDSPKPEAAQPPAQGRPGQQPGGGSAMGQPTKSDQNDNQQSAAHQANQVGRNRVQQATAQASAKLRQSGAAITKWLRTLAMNPEFWVGFLVFIVMCVAIGIAVYLITCTMNGQCTGTDPSQQGPNVGSDRDAILITLAKSGNAQAKIEYMLAHQQDIILELGKQKANEPDTANKEIIQKLIAAVGTLKPGTNYGDPNLPPERKKEKDAALAAFAEYEKICPGYNLVCLYADFANASIDGADPYQRKPTGYFADSRGAGGYRAGGGLHCGYDIAADPGTKVIAGWDGTWLGIAPWTDPPVTEWGVYQRVTDNGKTYQVGYGHIKPSKETGDVIRKGDVIGTIVINHVDIKWYPMKADGTRVSADRTGPCVDWGKFPYKTITGEEL